MTVSVVRIEADQLTALNQFYRQAGYRGRAGATERALALLEGESISAALRLMPLASHWWLRGLWVAPSRRGCGLGSHLLAALEKHLEGRPCICFAYPDAVPFYRRGGFEVEDSSALPPLFNRRLTRYRARGTALVPLISAAATV